VLAATPHLFQPEKARDLPSVDVSLSKAINAGQKSFLEAGANDAYTGSPSQATEAEGRRLYEVLKTMVVTEVTEHLEHVS
jgi:hypothetical protein